MNKYFNDNKMTYVYNLREDGYEDFLAVNGKGVYTLKNNESFVSVVILSGNVKLCWQDEFLELKKGDSIFIPANFETVLEGNAEIILSYV